MSRDPLPPISHDPDPARRAARARAVAEDVALHATGQPCPGCGQRARLSGGGGCACIRRRADHLADRCLAAAARIADARVVDLDARRHDRGPARGAAR